MQLERNKEEIEEGKNPDQTKILCLLCSAPVIDGSKWVPLQDNESLKSVFVTCFAEVHLSSSYSKIYIILTLVSFFVLLTKSRVKNKNKIKIFLRIVKDSDLSYSKFISMQSGQIQENWPNFRTLFEQGSYLTGHAISLAFFQKCLQQQNALNSLFHA